MVEVFPRMIDQENAAMRIPPKLVISANRFCSLGNAESALQTSVSRSS